MRESDMRGSTVVGLLTLTHCICLGASIIGIQYKFCIQCFTFQIIAKVA